MDPLLKSENGLCPEVNVYLISAKSLELVLSFVEIFEFFLQTLPEADTYLCRQIVVR